MPLTPSSPIAATAHAISSTAADLLDALPCDGNLVFSPLSIYVALATVLDGARGETRDALARALHYPSADPIAPSLAQLMAPLRRDADASEERLLHRDIAPAVTLDIGAGIWVAEGRRLQASFIDTARALGAAVATLDFAEKPAEASAIINSWIAGQTRHRIQSLSSPRDFHALTLLAIASAVYFKGIWDQEFGEPKPGRFRGLDGRKLTVPMMTRPAESLRVLKTDAGVAVEINYGRQVSRDVPLAMLVALPKERGEVAMRALERQIADVMTSPAFDRVVATLTMPPFHIDATLDLGPAVRRLGLEIAFDSRANFSGITGPGELWLDQVLHGAWIDVDRYGTEAAGATMMTFERSMQMPPRIREFRALHIRCARP